MAGLAVALFAVWVFLSTVAICTWSAAARHHKTCLAPGTPQASLPRSTAQPNPGARHDLHIHIRVIPPVYDQDRDR